MKSGGRKESDLRGAIDNDQENSNIKDDKKQEKKMMKIMLTIINLQEPLT